MSIISVGTTPAAERQPYRAYPLDVGGCIDGPAIFLAAQSDDEAVREARACVGDDRVEVWRGTRRVTQALAVAMTFRLTEAGSDHRDRARAERASHVLLPARRSVRTRPFE